MTVVSGQFGAVNAQASVSDWTISKTATTSAFVASNTKGGTGRVTSIQDWTGTFNQNVGEPTVLPGTSFTFQGALGPTTGVWDSNAVTYSGTAFMQQAAITWDFSASNIITSSLTFQGDGAVTGPTAATVKDTSAPAVKAVYGTKLQKAAATGTPTWEEVDNIASMSLTLTSDIKSYVNSSTAGWTKRLAGNYDWTAEVTLQDDAEPVAVGTDYKWRFFIDSTTYWELIWGQVTGYGNIAANPSSGDIVSKSFSIAMNGYADTSNPTDGIVTTPSSADWWDATTS